MSQELLDRIAALEARLARLEDRLARLELMVLHPPVIWRYDPAPKDERVKELQEAIFRGVQSIPVDEPHIVPAPQEKTLLGFPVKMAPPGDSIHEMGIPIFGQPPEQP